MREEIKNISEDSFPITIEIELNYWDDFRERTIFNESYHQWLDGREDTDQERELFYDGENASLQSLISGEIEITTPSQIYFKYCKEGLYYCYFTFKNINAFKEFFESNYDIQHDIIDDLKRSGII